ncbi:hypothetical protein [Variovorax sp. PBL-E5]|uniref:hypothetical protein n=1 Tax=Variovorax sp. PBL-E5 TaxID=434014 RepID=UPI0013A54341|nr:hypothetical protein [Variovorax sp. PBL-E5]
MLPAVAALLCGCAALPEPWRDFQAGWRTGHVIETGAAAGITRPVDSDCRTPAQARDPGRRFAVVLYGTHGGLLKLRVAPLAAASTLARDDWVQVNIERCDALRPPDSRSP